ncbi:PD-(D/E)XK nuclease-like domain-containing protein [Sporomusa sphaeroides]|uniref:Putative exodeoxyribonuclease 8 PDDEXK-like domain-containing protein n=1 Tax=Sporomusa sphaeroides DSM 2875 TaxID=1337886 RepID=A0ABM9VZZ5_9FIRM|nr:PD-(D/E)XK nuclease-like domain-containing protein [Sporomusa sphaeroides]OLS56399.1 hypothetical protein SPSPH_27920 [Sporomusa sphaeroides DSM 2875]CVK18494.1 hypothetical protein SSPH_01132 [Sporomusa sphaeroides DSM 2875]
MQLTAGNYHSQAANLHYMSVSQYKNWISCEAATLANLKGEYEPEDKTALLVGQYVHCWAEGPDALEKFICDHPEIISSKGPTKGELKSEYRHADEMIACLANDPKVMFYLQGRKEIILTAEMFGIPWKVKIDVDNPGLNYLLDLKTTKSITEHVWSDEIRKYVSFIEEWQYMIQVAVYSEVERIARGRDNWRDFYCIAVSKEKVPDHAIIDLTDHDRVQEELNKIRENMPRIIAVKAGKEPPVRCERCEYCRATKKVDKIIHYTELMPA